MTDEAVTPSARSLHRKLAQVMYEAERIPKHGHAPKEMGGYPFVQVGDAADFIRKALAEKLITMMPTGVQVVGQADRPTKSGGSMTTVDLVVTWTLTDGESGESIQIQSFGAGADGGDKYSGKASTSAMKYALLTGFLLSTGEDSELGNTPEQGTKAQDDGWTGPRDPRGRPAEAVTLLGDVSRTGKVVKGDAQGYDLEARQSPDGYAIGFKLEIAKDKNIPQVLADGPLGHALFLALGGEPLTLLKQRVTVRGRLYEVRPGPGRGNTFRLLLSAIETDDFTLPAEPGAESGAPGQEPLFTPDEEAAIAAAVDAAPTGAVA